MMTSMTPPLEHDADVHVHAPDVGCALCGIQYDQRLDAHLVKKWEAKIEESGWLVISTALPPPHTTTSFSYTVGLSRLDHFEFIQFGLPPETGHIALDDLASRVRDGERFEGGEHLDDLFAGYPGRLVKATKIEPFVIARRLYPIVRGLQLVWPDADARFPWEVGCTIDPEVQPLLGSPM